MGQKGNKNRTQKTRPDSWKATNNIVSKSFKSPNKQGKKHKNKWENKRTKPEREKTQKQTKTRENDEWVLPRERWIAEKNEREHWNHHNNNGWTRETDPKKPEPDPTSYLEFDPTLLSYHVDVVVVVCLRLCCVFWNNCPKIYKKWNDCVVEGVKGGRRTRGARRIVTKREPNFFII